jgi:hypothetical protein
MPKEHDRITTTVEREWLRRIVAGTKKNEYRDIKAYWTKRLKAVGRPFELRLINGMHHPIPEVTVLIDTVRKKRNTGRYALHIDKVLAYKHWDPDREVAKC